MFHSMHGQIWDMKTDVKNFNESLAEFLNIFFSKQNLDNDPDHTFRDFLIKVKFK